jgi:hypothetical protein
MAEGVLMSKTPREIALSACPEEVQSKVSEVAVRSGIPDDDPLWLVFLAATKTRTETKLMATLIAKIGALEEGMSLLTEALLENDTTVKDLRLQIEQSNQESQTLDQQAEQVRFTNLRRSLIASMITVVVLAALAAVQAVVIAMGKPTADHSTSQAPAPSQSTEVDNRKSIPDESEPTTLRELKSNLSPANQDRLELCLESQNPKCTLLIEDDQSYQEDAGFDEPE